MSTDDQFEALDTNRGASDGLPAADACAGVHRCDAVGGRSLLFDRGLPVQAVDTQVVCLA